jgi:hypothetical protein
VTDKLSSELSNPVSDESASASYTALVTNLITLIQQARVGAIRSVNVWLTSTYWRIGQRIVEHEQSGAARAGYGQELLKRLSRDLKSQLGRGFSERNLEQMRLFYLNWPRPPAVSADSISQTLSAKSWSLDISSGGGEDHLLITTLRFQRGSGVGPLVPLLA